MKVLRFWSVMRQRITCEFLPLVVLGLAFALETINSVHIISLVVSTVQEELLRSQPLVSIQEQSDLSRPRTSVNEVTVEKIPVLLIRDTVTAEQLHEIEVLTCKG